MRSLATIVFIFIAIGLNSQSGIDIKKLISFNKIELTPIEVIQTIEIQSGITINYSPAQLKNSRKINIKHLDVSIEDLLDLIKTNDDFEFILNQDNIFLIKNNHEKLQNNIISGYIKDKLSGEPLSGAYIRLNKTHAGAISDQNGYFTLKIINPNNDLLISYVGYSPILINTGNFKNGFLGEIFLQPSVNLKTVIINDSLRQTEPEIFDFKNELISTRLIKKIKKFGIYDAFNELQLLSGINKINDFQGGLSVDGLSPGDNLYLLDGIRIFEPNHSFGLFSAFSSNSINSVSVFKYDIPLKYESAGSSVFDFHTIDGNFSKTEVEFGISNTVLNTHLSIPIRKYKTSLICDFRQSLVGFYINSLIPDSKHIDFNKLNFNDLNIKITHNIKPGSKLNLILYSGKDHLKITNGTKYNLISDNNFHWGNQALGLNWNYLFPNNLNYNLILSNSAYNNLSYSTFSQYADDIPPNFLSIYSSTKLSESSLKNDFNYYRGNSKINFGANISLLNINPALGGTISGNEEFTPNIENSIDSSARIISLYFDQKYSINRKIELAYAIKGGYYESGNFPVWYVDPALHMIFKTSRKSFINLGYNYHSKYMHSLGSYAIGIPGMIWTLSNKDIMAQPF